MGAGAAVSGVLAPGVDHRSGCMDSAAILTTPREQESRLQPPSVTNHQLPFCGAGRSAGLPGAHAGVPQPRLSAAPVREGARPAAAGARPPAAGLGAGGQEARQAQGRACRHQRSRWVGCGPSSSGACKCLQRRGQHAWRRYRWRGCRSTAATADASVATRPASAARCSGGGSGAWLGTLHTSDGVVR